MNRLFVIVGAVGMLALPIPLVRGVLTDLEHPEGRVCHPAVYLVPLLVADALLVRELVRPPLRDRLQRLLDNARSLRAAGRHQEADRQLGKFERLWRWHRLQPPLEGSP